MTNHRGFTLVETLVSLFILSVVVVGAYTAVTQSVWSAQAIEHTFIASGLAQEGMEIVRNLRDRDWLADRPFGAFAVPCGSASCLYRAHWNATSLVAMADPPWKLYKSPTGLYDYSISGTSTQFSRRIEITRISPSELRVVVTIAWDERGIDKSISAEQHLYDWY